MERAFQVQDNQLEFRQVFQQNIDGVKISTEESQYLLPHFLMLLIGKPGSGKTTLLKQLLTNPQMYNKKFDEVIMVSPSYAKMDLQLKPQNQRSKFSLDWIFQRFQVINEQQTSKIYGKNAGARATANDKLSSTGKKVVSKPEVLNDPRSRFEMGAFFKNQGMSAGSEPKKKSKAETKQQQLDDDDEETQQDRQQMFKDIQKMPLEKQKESHVDVLLVLDDVVGSIKKAEFDPRLSQLVMNRRHLIFNGTISIIIVSQKYSLIPSRVRSNCNWIIAYQLNPMDFEYIYRDVIVTDQATWRKMLQFVFGQTFDQLTTGEDDNNDDRKQEDNDKKSGFNDYLKNKKFENLGIWVEFNIYFKNFKRMAV